MEETSANIFNVIETLQEKLIILTGKYFQAIFLENIIYIRSQVFFVCEWAKPM